MAERAETSLEDPQARLERALIDQFLMERGSSLATVGGQPQAEQKRLMTQASLYAAGRLAENDARAAYLHDLHGVQIPGASGATRAE